MYKATLQNYSRDHSNSLNRFFTLNHWSTQVWNQTNETSKEQFVGLDYIFVWCVLFLPATSFLIK